jgi:hypothetical protein
VRLNREKLLDLHNNLQDDWLEFISLSPSLVEQFPIIRSSAPTAFSLDFGQNYTFWVADPKQALQHRRSFISVPCWKDIRRLDLALAGSYSLVISALHTSSLSHFSHPFQQS